MNVAGGCLVVVFRESRSAQEALEFQREVFEKSILRETKGIIFDVSGVSSMDSFMSKRLVDICRGGLILGKKTVVVGLRPAVVASLVDLEIDLSRLRAAVNIEAAIALINPTNIDVTPPGATDSTSDDDDEIEEDDDRAEESDEDRPSESYEDPEE
jgi:rsbT antagonist protein RsbS